MYHRIGVLYHPGHSPKERFTDKLPVCAFYSNGEKLYAFEVSWQNLFDFIKMENRELFEVKFDPLLECWKLANDQPWGKRFKVPVMFRCAINEKGHTTITLKTGRWVKEFVLFPDRSRLISHQWDSKRHLIVQQSWCSFKGQ